MELRVITKSELEPFVQSELYQQFEDLPISPARAIAQSRNPNALPNDPALIIALEDQQVLAYFGMLPAMLRSAPDHKICWSSGWWVHPQKGRKASMKVFYKALQLWNKQMLFDELPEVSREVLKRIGGFSFREFAGKHCFLRFKLHKIIPRRFPALKWSGPVFKGVDYLMNGFLDLKFALFGSNAPNYQILDRPDEDSLQFIQSHQDKNFAGINQSYIKWILDYLWLTSDVSQKRDLENRYYFSSYAKKFENHFLKMEIDENLVAVIWLTWRDGTVRVPYAFMEEGNEELVMEAILDYLVKSRADTFICYQTPLLNVLAQGSNPFYHIKSITKIFGLPEEMENLMEKHPVIQDGDGDVVFT